ncbi:hypothetical protein E2C01_030024 [Portunus trituberculatus]|uniref:Uncharacterized protein n=1 Tax=Portunus trituberculatus TaxID=210409 RepID=A0A5B7EPV0_PORTR|nr:hypothetical protein [Portunus trituberculatus]
MRFVVALVTLAKAAKDKWAASTGSEAPASPQHPCTAAPSCIGLHPLPHPSPFNHHSDSIAPSSRPVFHQGLSHPSVMNTSGGTPHQLAEGERQGAMKGSLLLKVRPAFR